MLGLHGCSDVEKGTEGRVLFEQFLGFNSEIWGIVNDSNGASV